MQQLICLASDSLICFGVIRTFHVRILLFLPDTLCCCILAVSMHSDIRSVPCGSVSYVYILTCLSPSVAAVFFSYSFFTAFISTSIISHTIRFHLATSTYTVKLVAGTIL
jgi:hypothetical protein